MVTLVCEEGESESILFPVVKRYEKVVDVPELADLLYYGRIDVKDVRVLQRNSRDIILDLLHQSALYLPRDITVDAQEGYGHVV